MPSGDAVRRRLRVWVRVWVDAAGYAVAVTGLALVLGGAAGLGTGTGAVGAKIALFVVGWGLLAYATVTLWPRSPDEEDDPAPTGTGTDEGTMPERHDTTRFQAAVRALPPMRWVTPPPPADRMTVGGKLLLSSLLVLLVSFLMETVFGVGVGG